MSALMFVQIRFRGEPADFVPYRDAFLPLVVQHGARALVTGGNVDVLEGSHDGRTLAMFEFPSLESIHTFWNSAAYREVKRLRAGGADLDVWAVAGSQPTAPGKV